MQFLFECALKLILHHFFFEGEKSTRDEQVACAMLATQLDNFLRGDPVQHREVQGCESPEFMALFPRGVSYKVRKCQTQIEMYRFLKNCTAVHTGMDGLFDGPAGGFLSHHHTQISLSSAVVKRYLITSADDTFPR